MRPGPWQEVHGTARWCRCGKAEDVHDTPHAVKVHRPRPPQRTSASHQGWAPQERREGGWREGGIRVEKSARGWHRLRRFDSEVGPCTVSVRETLGKRFLLLARTGQGLLAFYQTNPISDQDQIQNFPSVLERNNEKGRSETGQFGAHTPCLQGRSLAVLLVPGRER
jgi:hypothetical protein